MLKEIYVVLNLILIKEERKNLIKDTKALYKIQKRNFNEEYKVACILIEEMEFKFNKIIKDLKELEKYSLEELKNIHIFLSEYLSLILVIEVKNV